MVKNAFLSRFNEKPKYLFLREMLLVGGVAQLVVPLSLMLKGIGFDPG